MFQDTLLDLLHTIMVLIEDFLRPFQVKVVFSIFFPRQADKCLQIVELHIEFRTLRIQIVQLLHFLKESLVDLSRPVFLLCLLYQFVFLRRRVISHLRLHVLNLLLQEIVTLLLVDVFACFVPDVCLQILEVDLTIDNFHHVEKSFLDRVHLQELHLFLGGKGHVGTNEIQCHDIV